MVDFKDLDYLPEAQPEKLEKATHKFPCQSCAGTGVWRGGYQNPQEGPCFSCGGKGFHLKPHAQAVRERKERGAKIKAGKAKARLERRAAVLSEHEDLIAWLRNNQSWNSFANSLIEQFDVSGKLTDGQIAAAERVMQKTEATRLAKAEAKTSDVGSVERIRELFDNAERAGKKRRALLGAHIEGEKVLGQIKLTPARPPKTDIWVRADGEFVGGIDANGRFKARYGCPDWVPAQLERIAQDPAKEARLYGRLTGVCCCCGRELTDPESIALGIGPICEANWGL